MDFEFDIWLDWIGMRSRMHNGLIAINTNKEKKNWNSRHNYQSMVWNGVDGYFP